MTAHKVTQADRELFKLLFDYGRPQVGAYVDAGRLDQAHDMQAIAAHRIAHEPKWLPIEDAPRDGSGFWVYWPHWYHFPLTAYIDCYQLHLADSTHSAPPWWFDMPNGPTHYQPLPTPPDEPAIRAMKGSKT